MEAAAAAAVAVVRRPLDVRLGETDAQVIRFGQLVVVHFDQSQHRLVHGAQLQQCHLAILTVGERGNGVADRLQQRSQTSRL